MFQMMGVFAEFERGIIRERVNAGLARARAKGTKGERNGNYKHGRYTAEMVAARRWLREAACMLRKLNKCTG